MALKLEDFQPIFGEAKPEWSTRPDNQDASAAALKNPYVFRVFASDPSHLTFHVTDFGSSTWESSRSVHQLDDMRDSIGIGGSWSDFLNYIISSLKSNDVKLVLDWHAKTNGAVNAKLVSRKLKGMPLISISLSKLPNSTASEAIANFSLELFKAYNKLQVSLVKEQERCFQLSGMISAEKDKNQAMKRKLDTALHSENQRLQKSPDLGNIASSLNSDTSSVTAALNSSEKQPAAEVQSTKVAHRAVPAYRRAKVRGVVLHDADEETDS